MGERFHVFEAGDARRPLETVSATERIVEIGGFIPLPAAGEPAANAFQMFHMLHLKGGEELLVDVHGEYQIRNPRFDIRNRL